MQKVSEDRRQIYEEIVFPLIDCNGQKVTCERRDGSDRRRERRSSAVARRIIRLLQ